MKSRFGLIVAILLAAVLPAKGAAPAPLADRIPADAILYIGWAGSDALGPKYDQSHFKAVIDSSEIPAVFNKFLPEIVQRISKDDKETSQVLKQLMEIGKPMWKHPSAVYFGGVDWDLAQPVPKLAILCDAGADAPTLVDQINALIEEGKKAGSGPYPLVRSYGTLVVFAFGNAAQVDQQFGAVAAQSMGNAPKFTASLQQVQQDPAFIEYLDTQSLIKVIDGGVKKNSDEKMFARWSKARDSLGISGLHEVIATMGFDGRDWATQGFVSTTDSDAGILSLFHGTPLSQDIFKAVPQSADKVIAGKFDLDGFVGHLHDMVAELDQETVQQFDEQLAQINTATGLDIRKDVLATFGDEWCAYSNRTTNGPGILGTVLVNRLKDADAADKGLTQLSHRLNSIIAQQMGDPKIKIEFHENVANGVTIHYLAVPFITPSWAVQDGNLYLGLYPQVVSSAVDQVKMHASSILDRGEYQALMHKLGDHAACSVEFYNLPATAADSYSDLMMISRLYFGMADIYGVHPPAMMIPPLNKITAELSPAGSVTWSDAQGLHMRSISPFPGCEIVAAGSVGSTIATGYATVTTAVLVPALSRARGQASAVKSMSNERQIGLGLIMYSNEHKGMMPDDLGELLTSGFIQSPAVFVTPNHGTAIPQNFATLAKDEQAKWITDNSDYAYLGKGKKITKIHNPSEMIVAYEKDGKHSPDSLAVLFYDGHVSKMQVEEFQDKLKLQDNAAN